MEKILFNIHIFVLPVQPEPISILTRLHYFYSLLWIFYLSVLSNFHADNLFLGSNIYYVSRKFITRFLQGFCKLTTRIYIKLMDLMDVAFLIQFTGGISYLTLKKCWGAFNFTRDYTICLKARAKARLSTCRS